MMPKRNKTTGKSDFLHREILILRYFDLLMILPILAAIAFATPLIDASPTNQMVFGIPYRVFTIFGLWLLMIFILAWINRALARKLSEREL